MSRLILPLLVTLSLLGCKREAPEGAVANENSTKTKPSISRIVFIDKEKCCACTRERVEKSWKALTAVVGYPPVPDVERIHLDSQAQKAEPYTKKRPIVVPPAIYFFDARGKLVEVLQGEVKSAQIKKVLGRS
jgi:hypothetical protein